MPARAHPSCRFYWVLWPEADSNRPHGIILHCHACPCTFRPFATPGVSQRLCRSDYYRYSSNTSSHKHCISIYPSPPSSPGLPSHILQNFSYSCSHLSLFRQSIYSLQRAYAAANPAAFNAKNAVKSDTSAENIPTAANSPSAVSATMCIIDFKVFIFFIVHF